MPAHRTKHHHRREVTRRREITFSGLLDSSVRSKDVFVGVGAGLALGAVVKYLLNRINAASGQVPAVVIAYSGPISTFLGGVALYALQRHGNRARGAGHLAGATAAALAPLVWTMLGKYGPKMADGTPFFSDYVMAPFGLLAADQAPYGLLTADGVQPRFAGNEDWDPLSAP